jgi:hypothetical protein
VVRRPTTTRPSCCAGPAEVRERAYAPYSGFRVGAVVVTADGHRVRGGQRGERLVPDDHLRRAVGHRHDGDHRGSAHRSSRWPWSGTVRIPAPPVGPAGRPSSSSVPTRRCTPPGDGGRPLVTHIASCCPTASVPSRLAQGSRELVERGTTTSTWRRSSPASATSSPRGTAAGLIAAGRTPQRGQVDLINRMWGSKVAIVTAVPGTTRNTIRGVHTRDDAQLVFLDTPGLAKPRTLLTTRLNALVRDTWAGVDLICFLVDVADGIGPGDEFLAGELRGRRHPRGGGRQQGRPGRVQGAVAAPAGTGSTGCAVRIGPSPPSSRCRRRPATTSTGSST